MNQTFTPYKEFWAELKWEGVEAYFYLSQNIFIYCL